MMKPLAGRPGPESAGAESDRFPWHGGGPGGPPGPDSGPNSTVTLRTPRSEEGPGAVMQTQLAIRSDSYRYRDWRPTYIYQY